MIPLRISIGGPWCPSRVTWVVAWVYMPLMVSMRSLGRRSSYSVHWRVAWLIILKALEKSK